MGMNDETSRAWWAAAEKLCPTEYGELASALAHHNPKRLERARKVAQSALERAMAGKGCPKP
jgi:hypothetical protein